MGRFIKERLASDKLVRVFAVGRIVHPVMFDLFGLAGDFDTVWLDQEHGGLSYDQIRMASICCRANGFDSFVRMAPTDYSRVTQNLEAGAGGLMAARIESADHAEQFMQWAKFAPRGSRGMNTSGRDSDYTYKTQVDFAADANRDHFISIQIETLGALKDADKIAAIDGVDLLFVGPSDLSQALGHLGEIGHTKVWEAIDRVAAACQKHGKHWGTVGPTPEYAGRAIEKGCRMISMASDLLAVRRGIESLKTAYAPFFKS